MLLYQAALAVLTTAALFKRASLFFACLLFVSWVATTLIGLYGNQIDVWMVDCLVSVLFTSMAIRWRSWWSALAAVFVLAAVPIHQWYWTAYAIQAPGWDGALWSIYGNGQRAAFLLAVAVLFIGNHDVPRLAARCLDWFGDKRWAVGHDCGPVLRHGCSWATQAPEGEEVRSGDGR